MLDTDAALADTDLPAGGALTGPAARSVGGGLLKLAGLDRIIGLHLGICHSKLVQRLDPQLKPLDLTAKQVTILWLANANANLTQADIARFLQIERATIHQFVRSLLKNGLIVIEPNPNDRRATRIGLTEAGRARLAEAQAVIAAHETEATSVLSEIERNLLLALLIKLHGT